MIRSWNMFEIIVLNYILSDAVALPQSESITIFLFVVVKSRHFHMFQSIFLQSRIQLEDRVWRKNRWTDQKLNVLEIGFEINILNFIFDISCTSQNLKSSLFLLLVVKNRHYTLIDIRQFQWWIQVETGETVTLCL